MVAWGSHSHGGDASNVQEQLLHVRELHATSAAFAAILRDGHIVARGDANCGGDSSHIHGRLAQRTEM